MFIYWWKLYLHTYWRHRIYIKFRNQVLQEIIQIKFPTGCYINLILPSLVSSLWKRLQLRNLCSLDLKPLEATRKFKPWTVNLMFSIIRVLAIRSVQLCALSGCEIITTTVVVKYTSDITVEHIFYQVSSEETEWVMEMTGGLGTTLSSTWPHY